MNRFSDCLKFVLDHEGGKSDDPLDRGGRTAYGITQLLGSGRDSKRVCYGFFWGPFELHDTLKDRGLRYAAYLFPFGQRVRLPGSSNSDGCSFVLALSFVSRPNAIFRRVPEVDIFALDAASDRALAHVSKEVFKTKPAVADGNAPATVVSKASCLFVGAPGLHGVPTNVCWGNALFPVVPVFDCMSSSGFSLPAAAGFSPTEAEISRANNAEISANALAKPLSLLVLVVRRSRKNQKTIELLPSKLRGFCTHSALLNVKHLVGAWKATVRSLFGSYPIHASVII